MTESSVCPLCREPNLCLSARNNRSVGESCWCQSADVIIPQALLAQIPLDKKGIACVCENCVKAFQVEFCDKNPGK